MSRIDELIQELCPDGVQFVALESIARTVPGLSGKTKADFSDGNARYVTYKSAFSNLTVDDAAPDFVKVGEGERQNSLHLGDVVITGSSENIDEVGMSSVVVREPVEPLYLNSFCFALRFHHQTLIPEFCKYLFRGENVRNQIRKSASGVTRINISKPRFMKVRIPVPPLEVQREIVRVLDTFTALEAELEAELEARRVQYAHYRQLMLDEVEAARKPLSDLGKWFGGMTPSKSNSLYWEGGTIPWLASMDVSDTTSEEIRGRITEAALQETSLSIVPSPSVAVVMRSNILRRRLPIGLINVDTTVNQDMRALVPKDGINADYVYQALRADSERIRLSCVRTDGSMAAVDSKLFFSWEIPLPSLKEQESVANALRKFETLVNDLSIGLPAELVARRKQYEHYRDRLLTFKELSA
ncbi:MAG: restriction endonuclease subunit S [Propionibacteriaceae bacterium]|jgi:type I restriction enzyme S subunit|nr:restriction endonuclease subunit S [Propionibacteriaceae bacterium]